MLPAPHPFYGTFAVLLVDFSFPSRNSFQAHYWADFIWKELLSLRNVVENMKPQWKLYLEISHVMSLNFVMVNMLLLFSNNIGRATIFFPRNQVLYCYVTKVNNDSLNDPKKKNWRLAPLKGICTGKFDNVTNTAADITWRFSPFVEPARSMLKPLLSLVVQSPSQQGFVFPSSKTDTEKVRCQKGSVKS